jgi:membrane protein DedA with SNARE-associated domain
MSRNFLSGLAWTLGVVLAAAAVIAWPHLNKGALLAMLIIALITAAVMLAIDPVRTQIGRAQVKRAQAPLPPRNGAQ